MPGGSRRGHQTQGILPKLAIPLPSLLPCTCLTCLPCTARFLKRTSTVACGSPALQAMVAGDTRVWCYKLAACEGTSAGRQAACSAARSRAAASQQLASDNVTAGGQARRRLPHLSILARTLAMKPSPSSVSCQGMLGLSKC